MRIARAFFVMLEIDPELMALLAFLSAVIDAAGDFGGVELLMRTRF